MKNIIKNEQTNSRSLSDSIISCTSISTNLNETKNLENVFHKRSITKGRRIKAYHPKMMIAYKSEAIRHIS